MAPAPERYSSEKVLAGNGVCLRNAYDADQSCSADTLLVPWYRDAGLADECPLEMLSCVASFFDLDYGPGRWAAWLRLPKQPGTRGGERQHCISGSRRQAVARWEAEVGANLTFGDLAEFIARRATPVSLKPVTVLGSRCAAAGVFLGIRGLPELRDQRIAPSTRLLERMKASHAAAYLDQIAWATDTPLPNVERYDSLARFDRFDEVIANSVFWLTLAVALGAIYQAANAFGVSGVVIALTHSPVVALALRQFVLNRVAQPLPSELNTFGDLARYIAARRVAPIGGPVGGSV